MNKSKKTDAYDESDRAPRDPIRDPILAAGIGSRIKAVADTLGTREEAAVAAGVSADMLYRYIREESPPPLRAMAALCKRAGFRLEWLAFDEGSRLASDEHVDVHAAEFLFVPRLAVEVSAGHGLDVENEVVLDRLAFKRSWIEGQISVTPANLVIVTARGDSMTPTFGDGDVLLVDTSRTDRREDGIYVIRTDHGVIAKRLQFSLDGGVTVISDNPSYSPQKYDPDQAEHLTVAGRVVWAGRKL